MCFLGSLLRPAVVFSSSLTTVSVPWVSIDFTVFTTVAGWLGDSFARSSRGAIGDATKPYVHLLPSTSGRILSLHAETALPTGPLVISRRLCASEVAGTSRISGRSTATGIRTLGSYGTAAPR